MCIDLHSDCRRVLMTVLSTQLIISTLGTCKVHLKLAHACPGVMRAFLSKQGGACKCTWCLPIIRLHPLLLLFACSLTMLTAGIYGKPNRSAWLHATGRQIYDFPAPITCESSRHHEAWMALPPFPMLRASWPIHASHICCKYLCTPSTRYHDYMVTCRSR